jgi:hypothetical protein
MNTTIYVTLSTTISTVNALHMRVLGETTTTSTLTFSEAINSLNALQSATMDAFHFEGGDNFINPVYVFSKEMGDVKEIVRQDMLITWETISDDENALIIGVFSK